MRFSLRWLFGLVAFAAVACLALIYTTDPLSYLLSAALFAYLMTAVLGTIFSNRARRPFWAGCAIVGWSYIATAYLPPRVQMPWFATSAILDRLHPKIARRVEFDPPVGMPSYPGAAYYTESPRGEPFHAAGQALAAFGWSIAGGLVAARFRRDNSNSPATHL